LIEFLKRGELDPPHAVLWSASPASDDSGFVTVSFSDGSLFLKDDNGRVFRLAWESAGEHAPPDLRAIKSNQRRRALPPGKYTISGYRVIRRDHEGREWFISATGPNIRRIELQPNQHHHVELSETINVNCKARAKATGVAIQMTLFGEQHSGLTIYRDGRRIPMRFVVTSASGAQLAAGSMDYG
jgi:hypothetical protein